MVVSSNRRDVNPLPLAVAPPNLSGTEVAVEVRAVEAGKEGAAIAVAAGDGAGAVGVAVFEHRQRQRAVVAVRGRVVAVEPFHPMPAVVLAAGAARRLEVDLFVVVLAHVGDPEVAGEPVE